MTPVHVPVLRAETLRLLAPRNDGELMLDCTLGEGGHAEAFLSSFPSLKIVGLDADKVIQERAKARLAPFAGRVSFRNAYFDDFLAEAADSSFDTILFDLGISIFHYELSGRGFSFRKDEELDMRINPEEGESVADIVATRREEELANLIYEFGEERYSRRIARAVVEARRQARITTSGELAEIVYRAVPPEYRRLALHPATRTFQALRIAANGELDRLGRALGEFMRVLKPGGVAGIITFHSLEDRMVKNRFRDLAKACTCPPEAPICRCGGRPRAEVLTKKPVEATEDEARSNPPSRSAKLRALRKAAEESVHV